MYEALDRRIPKNPKYADVMGVVDTGASMSKVKAISPTRQFLRRQGEIFKRLKPSTLAAILEEGEERTESVAEAGRGPRVVTYDEGDDVEYDKPYLVLDVRNDEDDFDSCRITDAVHFPAARLRADRVPPSIYRYKNREESMIVVYDTDERTASTVATMFVEKGWDNVFMLTGGLRTFAARHEAFVDGSLPTPPPSPASRTGSTRRSARRGPESRQSASTRSPAAGSVAAAGAASLSGESIVSRITRASRRP